MGYVPEGGVECRRLSVLLDQIDAEIECHEFRAKEQDLDKALTSTQRYYQAIAQEYDQLW